LERLLELLRTGGARRLDDVARELDVSPALVEAMLEELERMGRLRRLDGECSSRCGGCGAAAQCRAMRGRGRVWTLADFPDLV
jgi:predicted ArsR family transcriptional regulator